MILENISLVSTWRVKTLQLNESVFYIYIYTYTYIYIYGREIEFILIKDLFSSSVLESLDFHYKKEDINFVRYQKLIMEYGIEMPREILQSHLSPKTFQEWLQENEADFRQKLGGNNKWVRRLLYPNTGSAQMTDLEITSLNVIFTRLLEGFPPPNGGWFQEPAATDLSTGADLLRLAKLRNNFAHSLRCQLSDHEFDSKWQEAEKVVKRLGGSEAHFLRIKYGELPH